MGVEGLIEVFENGSDTSSEVITVTFIEGKNMRYIASIIEQNTNNKAEDVYNLLKDTEYINSLINEYWFLSEEIKNTNIYYLILIWTKHPIVFTWETYFMKNGK